MAVAAGSRAPAGERSDTPPGGAAAAASPLISVSKGDQTMNQGTPPATGYPPGPLPGQTIVIRERTGGVLLWIALGLVFFLSLLSGLLFLLVVALAASGDSYDDTLGLKETFHSGNRRARKKVAIIRVSGVIYSGEDVKRQVQRVRKDRHVQAVVLRINSPGGTITGADLAYHYLKELREEQSLPIVVSMGSVAASGGYYIAMAAGPGEDLIYAEPTTTTGSIGVIMPHYDVSEVLARIGVKDDSIVSHPLKQLGAMTKPLSDKERGILQAYVDESFRRFKEIVLASRPQLQGETPQSLVHVKTKQDVATGQIFTATQALEAGLVDQIGFIEDAIARARELAGLAEDETRVIEYEAPLSLVDLFVASPARPRQAKERFPAGALDGWRAQPYYLVPTAAHLPLVEPFVHLGIVRRPASRPDRR